MRPGRVLLTVVATTALLPAAAAAQLPRSTVDREDERSGGQVHLVYAVPADREDRSLDTNGTITNSFNVAHAWFRGPTGTNGRGLRVDTFLGSPDITYFRMPDDDATVAALGTQVRDRIELRLREEGLLQPEKIYLVYYDGRSDTACGGGAWPPPWGDIPGQVAALYLDGHFGDPDNLQACDSRLAGLGGTPGYREYSALHELLHTYGLVAPCAQRHHERGHILLEPNDLMYAPRPPPPPPPDPPPDPPPPPPPPPDPGWDVFGTMRLDIGNDDYYRHNFPNCLDLDDAPFMDTQPRLFAFVRERRVLFTRFLDLRLVPTDRVTVQVEGFHRGRRFALRFRSLEPGRITTMSFRAPSPVDRREPVTFTINAADRWGQYRIVTAQWPAASHYLRIGKRLRPRT